VKAVSSQLSSLSGPVRLRRHRGLLLVNANTTAALTDRLVAAARDLTDPDCTIIGATALFGPAYIASRADAAVAAHATTETISDAVRRRSPETFDACILACFGDPGLGAARETFPFPIVGMAEASILSALQLGDRFAIVTVGERWPRTSRCGKPASVPAAGGLSQCRAEHSI
jgi:allantoin racemase